MIDLAAAVAHLEAGDWESAHRIVQQDESSVLACWAHGIVHIMEGDPANAGYWYRRAGRPLPELGGESAPVVAAEIAALRTRLDA